MATLTFSIQPDGLICDALIGLDGKTTTDLVDAGQAVPAPIRCRALIDTGTDITCVASAVLRQLGLNVPVFKSKTRSTTGTAPVDLFEASIGVLDLRNLSRPTLVLPDVLVMEMTQPPANIEVLIGLDVLLTARLLLDGPGQFYTLDF